LVVTNAAAQVIVACPPGIAADRLVKFRDGMFGIGLAEERLGAGFVGVDKIRIKVQYGREVCERGIVLTVGNLNKSAIVGSAQIRSVELDRV
jgi:hypothetical protein